MNGYQLYLEYDNNKLYLAPRASIRVIETRGKFETINWSAGCCGQVNNREFKFVLEFIGGCSYASALALYNQLIAFLDLACDPEVDLLLYRRVWDEEPTVYKVDKAIYEMIDIVWQYSQQHVYSIELTVTLSQWPPPDTGVVEIA